MSHTYVIDTSVIIAYILPDEKLPSLMGRYLREYLTGEANFVAPDLQLIEVANVLKTAVARKRLTENEAQALLHAVLDMEVERYPVIIDKVLEVALTYNLTAYDACYIQLAQKMKLNVLSLDERVMNAWKKVSDK